jgi:hypothetical protein
MGFEGEVTRVVKDDLSPRIVAKKGFRTGGEKEWVILSPDRQRADGAEVLRKINKAWAVATDG